MLLKHILVPYDDSPPAYRSFRFALDMAKKYDSHIILVTCVEPLSLGIGWYDDPQVMRSALKRLNEIAKRHIQKLIDEAEKEGIATDFEIQETRSVVKTLISIAKSRNVDIIIMGSHGRTGFSKLILGSVANGVCQLARCPVLIVK